MAWTDELERYAKAGNPIPDGLSPNEKMLFVAMRGLYWQYAADYISLEQAKREKRQLLDNFKSSELREKCYEKSIKAWRWVDLNLNKCQCEECKALKRAILQLENAF